MEFINIKGACEHNLKEVDLKIPRGKFVVFTGVSGSGKSSLAFDTLFIEGKRRYVESLSNHARYLLGALEKPKFESITGLSPTIAIEKKSPSRNPRSTVGTLAEILDLYRILYARIGELHCYHCSRKIKSLSAAQIVERILKFPKKSKILLLSPLVEKQTGEHKEVLSFCKAEGFTRIRINQELFRLEEVTPLSKTKKHTIQLVIDRLTLNSDIRSRLTESVETALNMGKGRLIVLELSEQKEYFYSEQEICLYCNIEYPKLNPTLFSFNSPQGMCLSCKGLGVETLIDSVKEEEKAKDPKPLFCSNCLGTRLRTDLAKVWIEKKSISELTTVSIAENIVFFNSLKLSKKQQEISHELLKEIQTRLHCLQELGLYYLTLARPAYTLSGGEFQRIHLASQISSELSGILYILDEPSTGLHPEDTQTLIQILNDLKGRGNTVLVVEHDRETILKADYLVDFGPTAGKLGGEILYAGELNGLKKCARSLTGQYLSNQREIPFPQQKRTLNFKRCIELERVTANNLKGISIKIPAGSFTCITGVSGAGKSTLIHEVLAPYATKIFQRKEATLQGCKSIKGLQHFDKLIRIDQSPIGRSSKSNPATYTKIFDAIRETFAKTLEAKIRGYGATRFSFNNKGGRCEVCKGEGVHKIEMHFLPDVFVSCEECEGKRFNQATLSAKFKGKNIAEILEMTIEEALEIFRNHPKIRQGLETLIEVGLGYLQLGQPSTTLSGGEAQRIKLSKELSKKATGKTLYLLDEPTSGLHFEDIRKLIQLLQNLVEQGNTVLIIEHHLALIKQADYLIDLGPLGGENGGELLFAGTPEELVHCKKSKTGLFLKKLNRSNS